ncbi:hypothetical protein ACT009_09715 [Sphingomonas sp. Tas61C01]|uniref:hypothetical protein n=1 Tax=Sphingomonas sp. Tas61C01 TaxID=3458297 RepID=UPI00403E5049
MGGGAAARVEYREDPKKPPIRTIPEADAWRAKLLARYGDRPAYREAIEARYRRYKSTLDARPDPVTEFASGVGQGIAEVGKQAGKAIYSAVTTNPVSTARETIGGVADMIDAAIAAEATPARVQIARAADKVANASARDIGKAVGTVAGNAALVAAPGRRCCQGVGLASPADGKAQAKALPVAEDRMGQGEPRQEQCGYTLQRCRDGGTRRSSASVETHDAGRIEATRQIRRRAG